MVMSEEVDFLSYEEAKKIVGNVIEEEHIRELNRRILTVYDLDGNELCWFDAEDVLNELGFRASGKKLTDQMLEDEKMAAVEYVMKRIPTWVMENK